MAASRDGAKNPLWASVLAESERRKAERFSCENEKMNFIQRRAFRRYCAALAIRSDLPLSKIVFCKTPKGRPYIQEADEFWFSFSACRSGFLAAWSSNAAIGVDIEDKSQNLDPLALADFHFTEDENLQVTTTNERDRQQVFLELWCLKEAALKSIGEGIPFGLRVFEFKLQPTPKLIKVPADIEQLEQFKIDAMKTTDTVGAVVTKYLVN
ncbi:MAG: 4'-phosphopantetheinyl transferase family protein [Hyphomicrobiales bacterium]